MQRLPAALLLTARGRNGVYTAALLKALAMPGLKAEDVFKRARSDVVEQTKRQQTPWESSSLTGDFVFNLTVNVAPVVSAAGADRDALFWYSIQGSQRASDYE